ncbi:hypothetical protein [Pseudomonas fulva]|uniref:hypothetical protein n=1 Tax=Pseudomonas fulva TaxID=47880 RepID=UPI003CEE969F
MALEAYVSLRSKNNAGKPLFPHVHKDGMYVASHSRYEVDYVRVQTKEQLQALVEAGYGARMSNPSLKVAASIIISKNIKVTGSHSVLEELLKACEALELDVESSCKRRAEQTLLRTWLLGGAVLGKCVICSAELPENLLVAAHIKKRSCCSREEKLDFDAVAGLMCKLGCDDLFEKGYIYIQDGIVVQNYKASTTAHLDATLSRLVGNKAINWIKSQKYYIWHKEKWAKTS